MFRFAHPTVGPTTGAETLPDTRLPSHPQVAITHPKEVIEGTFWEKDVGSSPSKSHNETQRPPCLPPDSLEDIIVEKWVDEPRNPATDDVAAKTVSRNERARGVRFSPLGSRSKENRKTRSSASYTAVLPYKRDVPRNALVHLRYRHYYPRSSRGVDRRVQNARSIPEEPSAVPREPLFPHALDQCAPQFEYGRRLGGDCSPPEQRGPQAHLEVYGRVLEGCLPTCGERGVRADTTNEIMLDELDLEWARERFAQASIGDNYDSDMTG